MLFNIILHHLCIFEFSVEMILETDDKIFQIENFFIYIYIFLNLLT